MFMDNTHGNCPTACVSEGNYISLEDSDQNQQFSSEFFMSPAIQGDHAYADVVADPNEDGQHVSIDEIFEGAAPDSELDSMSLLHEPTVNYCKFISSLSPCCCVGKLYLKLTLGNHHVCRLFQPDCQ